MARMAGVPKASRNSSESMAVLEVKDGRAHEIAQRCSLEALDFELLRKETDIVGYPILPLVHQLVKQCGDAGRYIHWGATTQDIMDTATVLQVRDALDLVDADIAPARWRPCSRR